MEMKGSETSLAFALMQLGRKTSDRFRDVDEQTRRTIMDWFDRVGAAGHLRELVAHGGQLAGEEAGRMFGESLPRGLRLSSE